MINIEQFSKYYLHCPVESWLPCGSIWIFAYRFLITAAVKPTWCLSEEKLSSWRSAKVIIELGFCPSGYCFCPSSGCWAISLQRVMKIPFGTTLSRQRQWPVIQIVMVFIIIDKKTDLRNTENSLFLKVWIK